MVRISSINSKDELKRIEDGLAAKKNDPLAKSTLDEIEIRRKEIHKKKAQEDDFQKMEEQMKKQQKGEVEDIPKTEADDEAASAGAKYGDEVSKQIDEALKSTNKEVQLEGKVGSWFKDEIVSFNKKSTSKNWRTRCGVD